MSTMWLEYGSDTLSLDDYAVSINFPDIERNYSTIQGFSNNQNIIGDGSIAPGTISYTLVMKKGTSTTAFNTTRNTLNKWINLPKSAALYFVVQINGNDCYCRVYPAGKSGESYDSYSLSSEITYNFIMQTAYFQDEDLTTDNYTITSSSQSIAFTNLGTLPIFPIIHFTPSILFSILQITTYQNYGIRYEWTFPAGQEIIIDCNTGILTLAGVEIPNSQTGGTILNLESGLNTLTFNASSGSLDIKYYGRYN
jgi:hypothetical protein